MNRFCPRTGLRVGVALTLSAAVPACASSQTPPATAEEVRDGEAPPPAAPLPAAPGSSSSPTAISEAVVPSAATPPPEPPPAKEALSEDQIARVSELVNTAEVEQAKLAQSKAKSPGVKRFATMMIEHHGRALREQAKLVDRLNLKPDDSAIAAKLKADAERALDTLKNADAASFDVAYVTSQIDAHQKVLDLLDSQLLPAAKTPEVAGALRTARAAVEQHLKEAQALQTK